MTDLSKRIKFSNDAVESDSLLRLYKLVTIAILPLVLFLLLFHDALKVNVSDVHKVLLFYTAVSLTAIQVLTRFQLFKNNFEVIHYVFLFGIMIFNLIWFYDNPGTKEAASLLMAVILIGVIMLHPLATLLFNLLSFIAFIGIGIWNNVYHPEIIFIFLVGIVVVSFYNNWRYKQNKSLKESQKTFQGIFEGYDKQLYILSKELVIINLNREAKRYLNQNGVFNIKEKLFFDVFNAENEGCSDSFFEALKDLSSKGEVKIRANCSVNKNSEFIPKELKVVETRYFGQQVYLLTLSLLSEQINFEKELISKKENITRALDNIDSFLFNISFDEKDRFKHHVNYVSSKVEDIYGYSVDEYIALVKTERVSKNRHPEDRERIDNRFEKLLKKGGEDVWRFRMLVKDEWRWIEEKIIIEKKPQNTLVSIFGMVKDVSEEVEATSKLKNSEQEYRQLFEHNAAGVFKTNLKGEFLDCNIAFALMLGYDNREEILALKVEDIYFDKSHRKSYLKELQIKKHLNGFITQLKRKDGRRLFISNNVALLKNDLGEYDTLVGTTVDVTEMSENSYALKQNEEKYRLLFEESYNAILLIVFIDGEGIVLDANAQVDKLFGYEDNEVLGRSIVEFSGNAETKNQIENIETALKSSEKVELELIFKNKKGINFPAEASFVPVQVGEENICQVVIKDISEQKVYEQEILESRLSFKNIVDQSPASIFIFSQNELVYENPKGRELYLSSLNNESKQLFTIFADSDHSLIESLIQEADNQINSYTEIELGPDDKKFSINVVKTTYNKTKSYVFVLNDISLQTEYNAQKLRAELAEVTNLSLQEEIDRHKKTQQSLVRSTSRLQAIFESASSLYILSIDKNHNIISFNEKFKNGIKGLVGKDVKEGMSFIDIFPSNEYGSKAISLKFDKALSGEAVEMISHFPSVDGTEVWMESFMNPIIIEGQEIKEFSFIAHNVTEQIENRRRIYKSEENVRALLLAVPDILFRVNRDEVVTDYRASGESNRMALTKLVVSDNIIGKKLTDLMIDPLVSKEITSNVKKALDSNELVTHYFSVAINSEKDSERIHYENRYSKIDENEVVIVLRNVTDTVEYEEKLIESVKEKEVLLKEVHHRVKNNLQVINSILNLQSSYIKDEQTLRIIVESQNRIRSMSYIHESLYQTSDFSSISFDDYLTNLIQNLVQSYEVYSEKTKLNIDVHKVELALDQAIPCGLILNELITNSLKYAYPNHEGGEISISVKEKDGKVYMSVKDFGVGLPKGFKIEESDTLGLSLVDTLIDQLDGELIIKTEGGTEFLIIFGKQEI